MADITRTGIRGQKLGYLQHNPVIDFPVLIAREICLAGKEASGWADNNSSWVQTKGMRVQLDGLGLESFWFSRFRL